MALIKLNYGPYEANGIIRHRPQRLHGLITSLTASGYGVELVPSEHINRLTVDIYGVTVFRCDIRNLLFNIGAEDDVVCQRALAAIEEANGRIMKETNVAKFISIERGMRQIERNKILQTDGYLSTSNVGLLFEIQEQFKGTQPVPSSTKSKESNIRFENGEKEIDDEVSEITATDRTDETLRTPTYDETIDTSAPTSCVTSDIIIPSIVSTPETQQESIILFKDSQSSESTVVNVENIGTMPVKALVDVVDLDATN